jgi:hypothetical protein
MIKDVSCKMRGAIFMTEKEMKSLRGKERHFAMKHFNVKLLIIQYNRL